MKIGSEIPVRVDNVIVKDELLLRPIDEKHVAKLTIAYKWNPSAAPHIILQKVVNAFYVRIHCHSFCALRRAGIEQIKCRLIEGDEEEIIAYGLREQSQIKDFTPQQYHDNIIKIRDALIEKHEKCSFRDLEDFTHLKKSHIHRLIQGFSDDNVKELMDRGYSFTKAYREVHFVPLGDSQKVKESEEGITEEQPHEDDEESRIASTEEELEGQVATTSESVIPSQTFESDETGVNTPEISPDGEPESPDNLATVKGEPVHEETPGSESSPSPDYPIHVWMCQCGHYEESRIKLRQHECVTNGFQQYLNRVNRDLARAYIPSQKNGGEYWIPLTQFKEIAQNPQSIVHIEKEIEDTKDTLKKLENAFENAKTKIGGS